MVHTLRNRLSGKRATCSNLATTPPIHAQTPSAAPRSLPSSIPMEFIALILHIVGAPRPVTMDPESSNFSVDGSSLQQHSIHRPHALSHSSNWLNCSASNQSSLFTITTSASKKLTNATGTADVNVGQIPTLPKPNKLTSLKDRYKAFLRTLRMRRHLRMTKHGGRSYDHSGIGGTSARELAVLCPACPIPSVNLPPNWRTAGKADEYVDLSYDGPSSWIRCSRFLYYQTFGVNACFRFKQRQISSYKKDPELGPGYAYLVAWDSYSEYLRCFTNQQEAGFIYSSATHPQG